MDDADVRASLKITPSKVYGLAPSYTGPEFVIKARGVLRGFVQDLIPDLQSVGNIEGGLELVSTAPARLIPYSMAVSASWANWSVGIPWQ